MFCSWNFQDFRLRGSRVKKELRVIYSVLYGVNWVGDMEVLFIVGGLFMQKIKKSGLRVQGWGQLGFFFVGILIDFGMFCSYLSRDVKQVIGYISLKFKGKIRVGDVDLEIIFYRIDGI